MPNFKYKARNAEGQLIEGVLDAENEKELTVKLSEQNILLVEASSAKSVDMPAFYFGKVNNFGVFIIYLFTA